MGGQRLVTADEHVEHNHCCTVDHRHPHAQLPNNLLFAVVDCWAWLACDSPNYYQRLNHATEAERALSFHLKDLNNKNVVVVVMVVQFTLHFHEKEAIKCTLPSSQGYANQPSINLGMKYSNKIPSVNHCA